MNTLDLSPLYRNSVGFDRLAGLLNAATRSDQHAAGYPPYDIEVLEENRYAISLALAGFARDELEITVENGSLTVRGNRSDNSEHQYLHHGIAHRGFERKFDLADHVEVTDADLNNGLLTIHLVREVPEAMKPRSIAINSNATLEHHTDEPHHDAA